MSEIKGQLLGIVLTISIFGIVFGALVAAFTTLSKSVTDKIASVAEVSEPSKSQPANEKNNSYLLKF